MKPLIIANWKMNLSREEANELLSRIENIDNQADVVICPPFTALCSIAKNITKWKKNVSLGGQNCHYNHSGAYTGEISAPMLKDIGCQYVILGHSERRKYYNETNDLIAKKALSAHKVSLKTVICIGETLQEREDGKTLAVLASQMQGSIPISGDSGNVIVAYEPIWAIGTGKVATLEQITEAHDYINQYIAENFPLFNQPIDALCGGSVNAENAEDILAITSVGGALVGGASLDAESFNSIISASLSVAIEASSKAICSSSSSCKDGDPEN